MNVLKAYEKFGISKTEIFQGVRVFSQKRLQLFEELYRYMNFI